MSEFLRHLRMGTRLLARSPSATLGAFASLALGVAACSTVFTWINGILLQPFPGVERSGQYEVLATRTPSGALEPLSYRGYVDLQQAVTAFDHLVAAGATLHMLNLGAAEFSSQSERVFANLVSGNYFNALGVGMEIGRAFRTEEDRVPGRDPVVVISYGLWQRRFAGDRDIVGQTIHVNGQPCFVLGVADRRFVGTLVGLSVDLWVPIQMQPVLQPGAPSLEDRSARWIVGLGRLRAGVSRTQATSILQPLAQDLARRYPDTDDRQAVLVPIWRSPWGAQGGTGPLLLMLAGVVAFLLLLTCANVANLLLARAVGRGREMAVRLAIGASRAHIVRQLLTENLILALLAGAAGLVVAYLSSDIILAFFPPTDNPFIFGTGVDRSVLGFTLGLSTLTVLLFGVAPALRASRPDLIAVLKDESASFLDASDSRLRGALVVLQIALSVVLLAGAGLFLRSLDNARRLSPGFDPEGVLLATYDLSQLGYDAEKGRLFHQQVLERVATIGSVQSVTLASRVPLGFTPLRSTKISIDGYVAAPDEDMVVPLNIIGSDYFRTLRIPLREGREFSPQDTAASQPVALVNETMARRYWTDQATIVGSRVRIGQQDVLIVGVAADSKYRALSEEPVPHLYLPASQHYEPLLTLHVRTDGKDAVVVPLLRAEMQRLDAALPLYNVRTLTSHLGFATLLPRFSASALSTFGGLALAIAAVGIYSVVAFWVAARRRELGIRLAVGASPAGILMLVIRNGLKLTVAGIVLGLALAMVLARFIVTLLVDVDPVEPVAFGAVVLLLFAVAVAASALPAFRASQVDVVRALRW